jgi:hypothetical protein
VHHGADSWTAHRPFALKPWHLLVCLLVVLAIVAVAVADRRR